MRGRGRSRHGGEPTADPTTVKVSNKPRGNDHWTLVYMPLQENLGGEVGKGVLTGRGHFYDGACADGEETSVRAEGVVEVVEEDTVQHYSCYSNTKCFIALPPNRNLDPRF
jgi:hypothetical protein